MNAVEGDMMKIPICSALNERNEIISTETGDFEIYRSPITLSRRCASKQAIFTDCFEIGRRRDDEGGELLFGKDSYSTPATKDPPEKVFCGDQETKKVVKPFSRNSDSYFGKTDSVAGTKWSGYISNEVDIHKNNNNDQPKLLRFI